MPAAKFEIKRKCQVCGQEFIAKTIESWYCSKRCSNIAYKRRKDEEKRNQRLDEIVKSIPKHQDYIKVSEAWKSHSTLTLLATQNYPFWLKYD